MHESEPYCPVFWCPWRALQAGFHSNALCRALANPRGTPLTITVRSRHCIHGQRRRCASNIRLASWRSVWTEKDLIPKHRPFLRDMTIYQHQSSSVVSRAGSRRGFIFVRPSRLATALGARSRQTPNRKPRPACRCYPTFAGSERLTLCQRRGGPAAGNQKPGTRFVHAFRHVVSDARESGHLP